ncbi:MAG: Na+/H+ antiporter subunit E [Acidimicrobiia bacterium]|nr:Na+/H+ antiporter subunit E [Acidimicrobiia bacterium]
MSAVHDAGRAPTRLPHWRGAAAQFVILMIFWLVLSDQYRPLFIGLGVASAAVVTALTHRIVGMVLVQPTHHVLGWFVRAGWFAVYVVWMLWNITMSSLQIAWFVLVPGKRISPRFVTFSTELGRPLSRTLLALSITLVPGTMTVRVMDHRFLVHSLIPGSADSLASGRTQGLVARITGEEPEPAPEMTWGPVLEEPYQ